jgi:hypothetical protein
MIALSNIHGAFCHDVQQNAVIDPFKERCDGKPEDIRNALLTVKRTV